MKPSDNDKICVHHNDAERWNVAGKCRCCLLQRAEQAEAKCKELEAEIARLETEPCSALRWQQGEPTSNGFWWLRAGNLSPRVVRAYHNGSVMVHDYTGPVAVPYGNFECAGPLPEPAPNGRGEARESASVASTELLAQSKEKKP